MTASDFLTKEFWSEINHQWETGIIYEKYDHKNRPIVSIESKGVTPLFIIYHEYDDDHHTAYRYFSFGRGNKNNIFSEWWIQYTPDGMCDKKSRIFSRGIDGSVINWTSEKFVKERETIEFRKQISAGRIRKYDVYGNLIYHKDIDGFEMIRDLDNDGNLIKLTVKNITGNNVTIPS